MIYDMDAPSSLPTDVAIPDDLASCQALICKLLTSHGAKDQQLRSQDMALQEQAAKLEKLQRQKDELERLYNELLLRAFHKRSERYIANPDQLRLDLGDTSEAADAAAGLADAVEEAGVVIRQHVRRPRKKRDERLPEHLPRQETIAEPSDEQKTCPEHGQRTLLPESMWDRTEKLVYKPAELLVVVTKYPKYACQDQPQCGVASAERPTGLVEGDKYDTSVAAQVITAKYGYHLPIYRQQDYFASSGWTPCRSTLLNLLSAAHFVIEPLVEYFKHSVQQDEIIGCDETSVTLLYPKTIPKFDLDDPKQRRAEEVFREAAAEKKPSITARMWAYRGVTVPLNVFDFTVSRHRDGPQLFFADYRGKLIADCWSGFTAISAASDGAIQRGACTAHARRKVFDARETYRQDAHQLLAWFGQLYDVEDRAKDMSAEERLALRQSQGILEAMCYTADPLPVRQSALIQRASCSQPQSLRACKL